MKPLRVTLMALRKVNTPATLRPRANIPFSFFQAFLRESILPAAHLSPPSYLEEAVVLSSLRAARQQFHSVSTLSGPRRDAPAPANAISSQQTAPRHPGRNTSLLHYSEVDVDPCGDLVGIAVVCGCTCRVLGVSGCPWLHNKTARKGTAVCRAYFELRGIPDPIMCYGRFHHLLFSSTTGREQKKW